MASARAMKRAQGDALIRAAENVFGGGDEEASSSESEDDTPAHPANAFAILLGDDDDDDDESEPEPEPEPEPPKPEPTPTKKKKKKKKKKKGQVIDDEVDEVTAALRELGEEMPELRDDRVDFTGAGSADSTANNSNNSLMVVDKSRMKAEDELKSIFGSRVIHAVEMEDKTSNGRGGRNNVNTSRRTSYKSVLVTPKDTWPTRTSTNARQSGFTMEYLGVDGTGKKVFSFVHDDKMADAKNSYESAKASHDPNALVRMLAHYPWNAQALLALSDIHMYTGEGSQSAEILERCLYALEGSFHPWFLEAAVSGGARLGELEGTNCAEDKTDDDDNGDSEQSPNSTFLDALFKHTQALTRRGCHRAALECSKLSLGLDATDPTGLLCAVDYFALRCGETDWLLDFSDSFREDAGLLVYPGFAFSTSLARLGGGLRKDEQTREKNSDKKEKKKENESLSSVTTKETLLRAVLTHPSAVMALLERLDAGTVQSDARWITALTHVHFQNAKDETCNRGLQHLNTLFAERQHLLWRPDDALSKLRDACVEVTRIIDNGATVDGLCAADYTAIRNETFPPSDVESNPWRHRTAEDFSDVVKRQMPEGDENPFLAQPRGGQGVPANGDPELMADAVQQLLQGGNFDPDAAAAAGLDVAQIEALLDRVNREGGVDPAQIPELMRRLEDPEVMEAAGARAGGPVAGFFDFFRTLVVPQQGDNGGGLRREMDRQNQPPQEEHED